MREGGKGDEDFLNRYNLNKKGSLTEGVFFCFFTKQRFAVF